MRWDKLKVASSRGRGSGADEHVDHEAEPEPMGARVEKRSDVETLDTAEVFAASSEVEVWRSWDIRYAERQESAVKGESSDLWLGRGLLGLRMQVLADSVSC